MSLLCFCPAHLRRSLVNQAVRAGRRHGFPCSLCQRSFFVGAAVLFFVRSAIFALAADTTLYHYLMQCTFTNINEPETKHESPNIILLHEDFPSYIVCYI